MKLAVIGLGKMGSSLLQGILDSKQLTAEDIIACDIKVNVEDNNDKYWGIKTTPYNHEGAKTADMILLAVKPQIIDKVLEEIKEYTADKLIVSIAAGISCDYLAGRLDNSARIIRVMPNMPVQVKEGVSAVAAGPNTDESDLKLIENLFASVGEVVKVNEDLIDAITGLSGSGPAYVYMIIEALTDGGVLKGISREMAQKMAAQTVLGSAKMVLESGKHPGELKDMVTSPGGTTIEAIKVLEEKALRSSLIEAVKASADKAGELK